MAVFSPVTDAELAAWCVASGAGGPTAFRPTTGGVDNSNWYVETPNGRFALTLFEDTPRDAAERTLALTARLADAGLPVAIPWRIADGWTAPLHGRPAALTAWIDGEHADEPSRAQCAEIGRFLGRLHRVPCADLHPDRFGRDWRARTAREVGAALVPEDRALLDAALTGDRAGIPLPAGLLHADLFRDNALFAGSSLAGVVDFHYAATGPFIHDLAVAALDWCWRDGGYDRGRLLALAHGYGTQRAIGRAERAAWPDALRISAARFWLSRLADPRRTKDPAEMRARVAAAVAAPPALPGTGAEPA